jgi:superfamily II DNA or RNA helicase
MIAPALRDYQGQAVEACISALGKSVNPLLVAPTGAGKTVMAGEMMRRWQLEHGLPCYFFAHRSELLEQATATMERFGVQGKAFSVFQKSFDADRKDSALCVFDEAHHAVASSWTNVGTHFTGPKVAITATPDRLDHQKLETAGFTRVYDIKITDLIEKGHLVRPMAQKLSVAVCDNIMEAYDDAIEQVARNVVDEFYRYKRNKAMVFLPSVEASERFNRALQSMGMNSSHLDGTSGKLRSIAVDAFKNGDTQFLCNVALFTEGFDCPEVDCVVLLRETKSRALWSQMIGRGLRSFKGKTDCLILDPMWVSGTHTLTPADAFTSHPDSKCKPGVGLTDPMGDAIIEDQNAEARLIAKLKRLEREEAAEEAKERGLIDLSVVVPLFGFIPPPIEEGEGAMSNEQSLMLQRFQIYAPADLGAKQAAYILRKMNERQRLGLATPRQVRKLRQFGHTNANGYSFELASKAIGSDWRIAGRAVKYRKVFKLR